MPQPPDDPRPGDPFSARWLSSLAAFLRSLRIVSDGSITVEATPGGQVCRVNLPQEVDARITGGSQPYSAVESRPAGGGGWADLASGRAFTLARDPMFERNGNNAVAANTIVRAKRDPGSAAWIFERGKCTAVTQATPPAPTPDPGPTPPPPPGGSGGDTGGTGGTTPPPPATAPTGTIPPGADATLPPDPGATVPPGGSGPSSAASSSSAASDSGGASSPSLNPGPMSGLGAGGSGSYRPSPGPEGGLPGGG